MERNFCLKREAPFRALSDSHWLSTSAKRIKDIIPFQTQLLRPNFQKEDLTPVATLLKRQTSSLVERMLALHKQSARMPQEQEMLRREIESTDKAIDKLVYALYGLSDAEIAIVEGKA